MLKPLPGMGHKNKAEALFFREDRSPYKRASFQQNCDIGDERPDSSYIKWMQEKWGYNASKLGASSGKCCYLIKNTQQAIISKQVKYKRIVRNMSNEV